MVPLVVVEKRHGHFNCDEIDENVVLSLVPRPLTTLIMAMEMPAAIRPYSMAVAPDSSLGRTVAPARSSVSAGSGALNAWGYVAGDRLHYIRASVRSCHKNAWMRAAAMCRTTNEARKIADTTVWAIRYVVRSGDKG